MGIFILWQLNYKTQYVLNGNINEPLDYVQKKVLNWIGFWRLGRWKPNHRN